MKMTGGGAGAGGRGFGLLFVVKMRVLKDAEKGLATERGSTYTNGSRRCRKQPIRKTPQKELVFRCW